MSKEIKEKGLVLLDEAKRKFELACKDASALQVVDNFTSAFTAVNVVSLLREALSDEVMERVFMPLMNTKVGFLTDRNGRPRKNGVVQPPYSIPVVRDAIIDAVSIGLLPTGNQFNIIAERMYPTKEGYTALLRRLGVKYYIDVSYDKSQVADFAEVPCKISYSYNGEKNSFTIVATVKKDSYSSPDQIRGKAERRAKKALYEYITGCDFGDADEQSSQVDVVDVQSAGGEVPPEQKKTVTMPDYGDTYEEAKPGKDIPEVGQVEATPEGEVEDMPVGQPLFREPVPPQKPNF